jgi:putative SOS response-associated peptidase YedK
MPGLVSGDIHERAPLIFEESARNAWLSGEPADAHASGELGAAQEPQLTYDPVPKAVGSPKNDAPTLVEPIVT